MKFDAENVMIPYLLYDNEDKDLIKSAMIEFAKLHVEAALKAADKDAQIELGHCYSCGGATTLELQNTILNAYPLDNIK